jgi:hypothetical protein
MIPVLVLLLAAALSTAGALPEILCGCTDVLKNFA